MEPTVTAATALNRMLKPLTQSLSVEAARIIAALQIDPAIQAKVG